MDIEPRPLTPDERARIDRFNNRFLHPSCEPTFIDVLLGAEQYWREIVKNSSETVMVGTADWENACFFCEVPEGQGQPHKPDCPWAIANEL